MEDLVKENAIKALEDFIATLKKAKRVELEDFNHRQDINEIEPDFFGFRQYRPNGNHYVSFSIRYYMDEPEKDHDAFSKRLAIGCIESSHNRMYGTCFRCHKPWNKCEGHNVRVTDGQSCFALCEDCWKETNVQERLIYYKALFYNWEFLGSSQWENWGNVEQNILDDDSQG